MDAIREYILCVTGAAVICGAVKALVGRKGTAASLIHLICGLFLVVTAVSPLVKLEIGDLQDYLSGFELETDQIVAQGEMDAQLAMKDIIKEQTQAYILDKAGSLEVEIEVTVTLSDSDPPIPCAVFIAGDVSPYAKARLSRIMEEDLGIPGEAQQWSA